MVADLGLGKSLDMSSRLTMIAGTPSFVAPEQAQGEPLDPRADQYSLAALTYLLLAAGRRSRHASLSAAAAPGAAAAAVDRRSGRTRPRSRPSSAAGSRPTARTGGPTSRRTSPRWRPRSAPVRRRRTPEPWLPLDPQLTQPGAAALAAGRRRAAAGAGAAAAYAGAGCWPSAVAAAGPRGGAGVGRLRRRAARSDAEVDGRPTTSRLAERDRARRVGPARSPTDGWRPPGADDRLPGAVGRHAPTAGRDPESTPRASSSACCPATELPDAVPAAPRVRDGRRAGRRRRPLAATSATVVYTRLPRRRHRRAGRPGDRRPAALGPGAQRTTRAPPTGCSTTSTSTACDGRSVVGRGRDPLEQVGHPLAVRLAPGDRDGGVRLGRSPAAAASAPSPPAGSRRRGRSP